MSDFDIDAILAIETAASKRGEEAGIVEGHGETLRAISNYDMIL